MNARTIRVAHSLLLCCAALAAACGKGSHPYVAPAPQSHVALPATAAALKAWNPTKQNTPYPTAMAQVANDQVFVVLDNFVADGSFTLNGPGIVAVVQPSTGNTTLIDLAGTIGPQPEHFCTNPAAIKAAGTKLYVACAGAFGATTTPGRALVEVDATSLAVTRTAAMPDGFSPDALAIADSKIWLGDENSGSLVSVDRTSFAVVDGADGSHPAIALHCPSGDANVYVPDLVVAGGFLYALCGDFTSGSLERFDAASGALKDTALVGGGPAKMAATNDGRIAIGLSTSGKITLVTPSASGMTAAQGYFTLNSSDLEGLAVRDNFLYVASPGSAGSPTAAKFDLHAAAGAAPVAQLGTGDGTNPQMVLPLDDDQAVVSNPGTGEIIGVKFVAAVH
jgi:hypothetical protein